MADAMLPLFGEMPSVPVVVKDHDSFRHDPCPLAVYDAPSSLFFNKAKVGYVWSTCAVAVLLWMGVEALREIGSDRSSVKKALRKAAKLEVVAPVEVVRPRKE